MIVIRQRGNFNNTERFLKKNSKRDYRMILEKYAKLGVSVLSSATPVDSSLTSQSWGYEVKVENGSYSITWTNSNVQNGVPVVILLQYGHATKNGGYVQGYDFINPSLRPVFDQLSNELWKEVCQ